MIDLYKILGVPKKATPQRIRKAYRKLAMQYHPDRNPGDEEAAAKFKEVQTAHETLSDEGKRARYDTFGEVDDGRPDNSVGQVIQAISIAFGSVMEALLEAGRDLKHENLASLMRDCMKQRIADLRKQEKGMKVGLESLNIVAERFSMEEGDNVMKDVVRGQAVHVEAGLKKLAADLAVVEKAFEVMKKCRYRADIQQVMAMKSSGWATWTSATGS